MTDPSHPRLDAVDPITEELATVYQQTAFVSILGVEGTALSLLEIIQ